MTSSLIQQRKSSPQCHSVLKKTKEIIPLSKAGAHFIHPFQQNKSLPQFRSEYNVYSTFQSHEPEFDYLKSLEIEEKINKIRWLPQKNAAQFLLSTNGKSVTANICDYSDNFILSTKKLCLLDCESLQSLSCSS